jgi:hypothetical protein
VTIEVLPDVALLEIFHCYVNQVGEEDDYYLEIQAWHTLVHVCRKWRSVVFGSPLRLNLRLLCKEETPVREMAVWPPLPIVIRYSWPTTTWGIDNIMAALEHNGRVCEISLLEVTSLELEEVLAPMQKPYLALTDLCISWLDDHGAAPIVPESFLGGSAPRLRVSTWTTFHFRDYQNYFCRPLTSLLSTFGTFQIQATSPPRRSSLVSPRRLVWKYFGWDSNPLYLALRGKADVRLHLHAPSSRLSLYFHSKGPVNTWKI